MLQKPDKEPSEPASYRPIYLLPIMSKLLRTLLLKILKIFLDKHKQLPDHQLGFRQEHSTI